MYLLKSHHIRLCHHIVLYTVLDHLEHIITNISHIKVNVDDAIYKKVSSVSEKDNHKPMRGKCIIYCNQV